MAEDRAQVDGLSSRADLMERQLDDRFESTMNVTTDDVRLMGEALDNKIETLRSNMEQYVANNNLQGMATEDFVRDILGDTVRSLKELQSQVGVMEFRLGGSENSVVSLREEFEALQEQVVQ